MIDEFDIMLVVVTIFSIASNYYLLSRLDQYEKKYGELEDNKNVDN